MRFEDIPIVAISLDRRPDRWEQFSKRAAAAGIYGKTQRLSAVDATTFVAHEHPAITLLTSYTIKNKLRRAHYEIDSAGAVGCSLSHFKAWEFLKSSSAPALIIFEDDSLIPVDFKERIATLLSELPAEWDLITFYNTPYQGGKSGCVPIASQQPWSNCTSIMGSHAYMISRRGAERLLARAYPIEMHVDTYMAFMSRMGHIVMLWNPTMQIVQDAEDSDIQHGHTSILNVPTDMEKHGIVALEITAVVGMMTMAAVVGGILALAYVGKR